MAPTAAARTATPATSSAALPSEVADSIFDQYAQDHGLTAHGDIALLEQGAHSICAAYGRDATFAQIISALTQNGWTGYEAGEMNGASVAAYCPQYKNKAP